MFWSHPAENGSPPALQSHIQSHIQSKMADLQPSSHVREKSGAICKIRAKYIQRVQRALSPCRSENHIQNHIHGKFRGLKSHLITSKGHIRAKFRGQSHPSGHIRKHIRTKSSHFQGAALALWRPAALATMRKQGTPTCIRSMRPDPCMHGEYHACSQGNFPAA